MQNKELSHPKKKMDIKVDYAQLPASPASGGSPEFLAPTVWEITTLNNLGEEQAPLKTVDFHTYACIYLLFSCVGEAAH